MRYGFGRNWAEFIEQHFTEERIDVAQRHLLNFLKREDLEELTFLDIGCGSGLHSLGAYRAGAARITGFDYDPDSVETSKKLREWAGEPANWTVCQGSVLDRAFVESLEKADVVYSWGVLHHTGDMWNAIENAASRMKDDAVFYIALYTADVYTDPTPEYWLDVKRRYNRAGALRRKLMEWAYAWKFTIVPELRSRRNPLKRILRHQATRGMSYWTDVRDWLGGYPMEFAGIAETKTFCGDRLGLELLNINAGEANTEYLFRRKGARNYWDDVARDLEIVALEGPFPRRQGHAYEASLPAYSVSADSMEHPRRSRLMLYEDGVPVGFAHSVHSHIEAHGGGRYSHWGDSLIFSATDSTDPNTNGRRYSVCASML